MPPFLKVLDLMEEVSEENEGEDLAGDEPAKERGDWSPPDYEDDVSYHSDSDSTIMMSGNSPFITKAARCNFLSRSGKAHPHLMHYFPFPKFSSSVV